MLKAVENPWQFSFITGETLKEIIMRGLLNGVNYSDPTGMVIASVFSKVAATVKTIAQNTVKKATSVFSAQTVKTQTTNKITGLITKSGQTGK